MSTWPPMLRNVASCVEYKLQRHPDVSQAWVEAHFPSVASSAGHSVKGASWTGFPGVEASRLRSASHRGPYKTAGLEKAEILTFHVKPLNF